MHEAQSTHRNTVFFCTDRTDFVAKYFVKKKKWFSFAVKLVFFIFFSVPSHRQMFNLWLACVSELEHTINKLVLKYHQIR
jgi:hypothetical protein